jgi:hypothetical protein
MNSSPINPRCETKGTREESHQALFADAKINSPPLWQLENVETFSRACHAFGEGCIPHIKIVSQKVSENPTEK